MDAALAQIDSDMKKVRTHRFKGVKYDICVDESFFGYCDLPDISKQNPDLVLPDGLARGNGKKARQDLNILLHECLHASSGCWHYLADDKKVDRVAIEIGSLLWRLGYRRK